MPSIKGTASIASSTALQKQLRSTAFPSNFSEKCNVARVHRTVLAHWIERRVESILGFDDDIVSSTAVHLFLPEPQDGGLGGNNAAADYWDVDPRRAQLDLEGFLGEREAASFASELWTMMLDAQNSPSGIPKVLVEKKKEEMRRQREEMQQQKQRGFGRHHDVVGRGSVGSLPPPAALGRGGGEMNAFVREASRRAEAARAAILADRPPPPAAAAAAAAAVGVGVSAGGGSTNAANPPPAAGAAPAVDGGPVPVPPSPSPPPVGGDDFVDRDVRGPRGGIAGKDNRDRDDRRAGGGDYYRRDEARGGGKWDPHEGGGRSHRRGGNNYYDDAPPSRRYGRDDGDGYHRNDDYDRRYYNDRRGGGGGDRGGGLDEFGRDRRWREPGVGRGNNVNDGGRGGDNGGGNARRAYRGAFDGRKDPPRESVEVGLLFAVT
ncbi:hypothetical protein ACHAXA_006715 [Cyclostephanos tholiformis]|uniref:PWI domain-containing protein n=1 Tax=Cyclostephanos tholiformis TaxID=382380 RepID=A0ABD3SRV2_9STRA